jgi:iron complex transport system substrate-binding protein
MDGQSTSPSSPMPDTAPPSHASALRIASLQPSITITLERLGRLDTLVACTRYCLEALPGLRARNLSIIADSWSTTMEELLAVRPNLVIASVPYRPESLAAILRAGCPVLALAPHCLADIYADIRLLASVVNAFEAGERLVAQMSADLDSVRTASAAALTLPRVYCEEWGKPLIHSQPWVQELIEASGGIFVGEAGKTTTAEEVIAADPDVLLFAWCGAGDRVPLSRVVEKRAWQNLRAVQSGRVHCIPDEFLNTPAPTLLDGLACIASVLHPKLFGTHPRVISMTDSQKMRETNILKG